MSNSSRPSWTHLQKRTPETEGAPSGSGPSPHHQPPSGYPTGANPGQSFAPGASAPIGHPVQPANVLAQTRVGLVTHHHLHVGRIAIDRRQILDARIRFPWLQLLLAVALGFAAALGVAAIASNTWDFIRQPERNQVDSLRADLDQLRAMSAAEYLAACASKSSICYPTYQDGGYWIVRSGYWRGGPRLPHLLERNASGEVLVHDVEVAAREQANRVSVMQQHAQEQLHWSWWRTYGLLALALAACAATLLIGLGLLAWLPYRYALVVHLRDQTQSVAGRGKKGDLHPLMSALLSSGQRP